MKIKIAWTVFLFLVIMILIAGRIPLLPADIQVTTSQDQVPGSLRDAINIANNNNEDDTIHLPAGTYFLSGEPREDANSGGDLDINTAHTITISGNHWETTIIDGNGKYRVFHILSGTVSISHVTIQNGSPKCPSFSCQNNSSKDLELEHGGGVYNGGTLTLENCKITNNKSKDGCYLCPGGWSAGSNGSHGGGIYNSGELTMRDCAISNNQSGNWGFNGLDPTLPGSGGGIYNTGTLTMTDCQVKENTTGIAAGSGAGIYNKGTINLTRCTISDNATADGSGCRHCDMGTSGGSGGGIFNSGEKANLFHCTITNNTTGKGGPGDFVQGFAGNGAGIANSGEMTLENCTISANTTGEDNAGAGGGIASSGQMTLINCTISENNTGKGIDPWSGEHFNGSGAGICVFDGKVTLTSCTVSNNRTGPEDVEIIGGHGGGIYVPYGGECFMKNTIAANNQVYPGSEGPDCYGYIYSEGYNLIEDPADINWLGDLSGNLTGVDPLLGALAYNGGLTQTHALLEGSPAIDAGSANGLTIDQRGKTRPFDMPTITNANDGADIGAYERSSLYSISGQITGNGTGLADVTLTFSNGGGTTITDADGNYSHPIETNWSGTVTPSKEDYTFTPVSKNYANVNSNYSHQDYTAVPYGVSVTITNPGNGATVAGTVTITAEVSSAPQNQRAAVQAVSKVEFYIDDTLLGEDSGAPFQYDWNTGLSGNGDHTIKAIAFNAANQSGEDKISVTVSNDNHLVLSRSQLNLAYVKQGQSTYQQEFLITNSGSGVLNWTVKDNVDWLECSPASGTNAKVVTVTMDNYYNKAPGTYTGTITVESPDADNSPQTITVNMKILKAGSSQPPFGSFDTPIANSTVMSSVPFTGWVIDDIGVRTVSIFRKPLSGEGNQYIFIGNAVFVEGARPDIQQKYSGYPGNYQAGWGYMMLTNFLPNQGNGYFTFRVIARDVEDKETILGTKTVFCNNQNAVKPYGALDTPAQGGKASGKDFINFGWVLTPLPNKIPVDGSTITVWVDGVALGSPVYNKYRSDIANLFPDTKNSDGAGGNFTLDTNQYQDGIHTIAWSVTDNAGNTDGIGSRYFQILNESTNRKAQSSTCLGHKDDFSRIPVENSLPIRLKKGYDVRSQPQKIYPDNEGKRIIKARELERLEIHFEGTTAASDWTGYQVIGDQYYTLPIGSTLDKQKGVYYWQLGSGYLKNHELVFFQHTATGKINKWHIFIEVTPKFPLTLAGN